MSGYLIRHAQVFFYSLGQLSRTPIATLLTSAVIGIALALPMGFQVILQNARLVTHSWDGAAQISLFLKEGVSEQQANKIKGYLEGLEEIKSVSYISRQQALEEFRSESGFGDALRALEDNPLPAVLVIYPRSEYSDPATVNSLKATLALHPNVDMALLDMQWLKRLQAIMQGLERGVLILGALLALAVILITGNTIRLAIENRRDEIVITKLIGATDTFIRRPFLYSGMWYGISGGVLAWILISVALWFLGEPVRRLSSLYQSDFSLNYLSLFDTGILFGAGIALGLLGSWTAVGRHLRAIEPT
ncbi:MAG: permease-like cell division protein FtsX [Gammaproteobacteria bacterium]|nr:MAG: permease-like cell division protein FtsX [Gammaproteobacteria bacterium]